MLPHTRTFTYTHAPPQQIDLHRLLLSVHGFFVALGAEEIRKRGSSEDKPLRMVKTLLHEVRVLCVHTRA